MRKALVAFSLFTGIPWRAGVSFRRHPALIPRSEEEAMSQAIVTTKPVGFLPAISWTTRIDYAG